MSRLMRDGTAEIVSRDQILRREQGQENIFSPVQLITSRNGNLTRFSLALAICDDYTNIHTLIQEKYTNPNDMFVQYVRPPLNYSRVWINRVRSPNLLVVS